MHLILRRVLSALLASTLMWYGPAPIETVLAQEKVHQNNIVQASDLARTRSVNRNAFSTALWSSSSKHFYPVDPKSININTRGPYQQNLSKAEEQVPSIEKNYISATSAMYDDPTTFDDDLRRAGMQLALLESAFAKGRPVHQYRPLLAHAVASSQTLVVTLRTQSGASNSQENLALATQIANGAAMLQKQWKPDGDGISRRGFIRGLLAGATALVTSVNLPGAGALFAQTVRLVDISRIVPQGIINDSLRFINTQRFSSPRTMGGFSFTNLFQSYKADPSHPFSRHIAQYGRIWIYDAALGIMADLKTGNRSGAKAAVKALVDLANEEERRGFKGLWHFSYNTIGDNFIDPRGPMGANLWAVNAIYSYINQTGDTTHLEWVNNKVRTFLFDQQVMDSSDPRNGLIRAGLYNAEDYAKKDGMGYGVYSGNMNVQSENAIGEHSANYVTTLRLAYKTNKKRGNESQAFYDQLAQRHERLIQGILRLRDGDHFVTAIGLLAELTSEERKKILPRHILDDTFYLNVSVAVDNNSWVAQTVLPYNEEMAWQSIQYNWSNLRKTVRVSVGNVTEDVTGLFFFQGNFKDPYVQPNPDYENMVQPEATFGFIAFLYQFMQTTQDASRREKAGRMLSELYDGMLRLKKAYTEPGFPYATLDIQGFFNRQYSMAGSATALITNRILQGQSGDDFFGPPHPDMVVNGTRPTLPRDIELKVPEVGRGFVASAPAATAVRNPTAPASPQAAGNITAEVLSFTDSQVRIQLNNVPPGAIATLWKKTDVWYIQPDAKSSFTIAPSGAVTLTTRKGDLEAGKTLVLIVDEAGFEQARHDAQIMRNPTYFADWELDKLKAVPGVVHLDVLVNGDGVNLNAPGDGIGWGSIIQKLWGSEATIGRRSFLQGATGLAAAFLTSRADAQIRSLTPTLPQLPSLDTYAPSDIQFLLDQQITDRILRGGSFRDVQLGGLFDNFGREEGHPDAGLFRHGRVSIFGTARTIMALDSNGHHEEALAALKALRRLSDREEDLGFELLWHNALNTDGDDYVEPRGSMGSNLWGINAFLNHMDKTGNIEDLEWLIDKIGRFIFTQQIDDTNDGRHGLVTAGLFTEGDLSGYDTHSSTLNTRLLHTVTEHQIDYIAMLRRLYDIVSRFVEPSTEQQQLLSTIKERHENVMLAIRRTLRINYFEFYNAEGRLERRGSSPHYATGTDALGNPIADSAADTDIWTAGALIDYSLDEALELILHAESTYVNEIRFPEHSGFSHPSQGGASTYTRRGLEGASLWEIASLREILHTGTRFQSLAEPTVGVNPAVTTQPDRSTYHGSHILGVHFYGRYRLTDSSVRGPQDQYPGELHPEITADYLALLRRVNMSHLLQNRIDALTRGLEHFRDHVKGSPGVPNSGPQGILDEFTTLREAAATAASSMLANGDYEHVVPKPHPNLTVDGASPIAADGISGRSLISLLVVTTLLGFSVGIVVEHNVHIAERIFDDPLSAQLGEATGPEIKDFSPSGFTLFVRHLSPERLEGAVAVLYKLTDIYYLQPYAVAPGTNRPSMFDISSTGEIRLTSHHNDLERDGKTVVLIVNRKEFLELHQEESAVQVYSGDFNRFNPIDIIHVPDGIKQTTVLAPVLARSQSNPTLAVHAQVSDAVGPPVAGQILGQAAELGIGHELLAAEILKTIPEIHAGGLQGFYRQVLSSGLESARRIQGAATGFTLIDANLLGPLDLALLEQLASSPTFAGRVALVTPNTEFVSPVPGIPVVNNLSDLGALPEARSELTVVFASDRLLNEAGTSGALRPQTLGSLERAFVIPASDLRSRFIPLMASEIIRAQGDLDAMHTVVRVLLKSLANLGVLPILPEEEHELRELAGEVELLIESA